MDAILGDAHGVHSVAEAHAHGPSQDDGTGPFHTTRRKLDALALVGFALPVAAYFFLIHHYGVNTIYGDQWYNVSLVEHPLSFSALWAQHDEHRIFFPNLIVVVLAHTTHLNVLLEEYLSAVALCVALGLFVLADKRSFRSTPWIYYCPVAFVLLSYVQAGSTLFGFQLSWYLSILALAVALFLLDRPDRSTLALTGATAAAVFGSFSAFEGLFIWPVGLLVLYRRHCSRGQALAWIASAVITGAAYFHNYHWTGSSYWYTHPTLTIKFFLLAIGDVVGAQLSNPSTGNKAVLALGILIFAVACWVIVVYGLRRGPQTGGSVGVALVCFGLLFAVTFAIGRVDGGLSFAAASQYTTFDLLILVGCYLALLNPPARLETRRLERLSWPILRMLILGAVLLQVALGSVNGVTTARTMYAYEVSVSDITANIDRAPATLDHFELLASHEWIRHMAHVAAVSGSQSLRYERRCFLQNRGSPSILLNAEHENALACKPGHSVGHHPARCRRHKRGSDNEAGVSSFGRVISQ